MMNRATLTGPCKRVGLVGITTGALALNLAGGAPPKVGTAVQLPTDPGVPCVSDRVGPSLSVSPYVYGQPARIIVAWSVVDAAGPSFNVECAICLNDNLAFTTQSLAWPTPCNDGWRTDPTTCVSPATGDL